MEFESNCQVCHKTDFLPFRCPQCKQSFCPDHRFPDNHSCINIPGKTSDATSAIPVEPLPKQSCSFNACSQVDILVSTCRDCKQVFCLSHRHPPDHGCSSISSQPSKKSVPVSASKVSKKTAKPNPKLDLMKLKLNAKGDGNIAMENRFYFQIEYPDGKTEGLFYNQSIVVGRLLDIVLSRAGLLTKSNQTVQNCLVNPITNLVLPTGQTCKQLLDQGLVYNGQLLQLK